MDWFFWKNIGPAFLEDNNHSALIELKGYHILCAIFSLRCGIGGAIALYQNQTKILLIIAVISGIGFVMLNL